MFESIRESNPQKINVLQGLRGIAILLVVFYHLRIVEIKYSGDALLAAVPSLGFDGVDLFFVISGFAIATAARGKFRSTPAGLSFLYNRLSRIYPLYWVYTLITLAVYVINPTLVNSAQGNRVDVLASFLLLPNHLLPLLNVAWTLVHQVYFYLVFTSFLFFLDERWLSTALIGWAISVGVGQMIGSLTGWNQDAAFALVTNPLTFEFIAGCLVARLVQQDFTKRGLQLLWAGLAMYLVACLAQINNSFSPNDFTWVRVLTFGSADVLIVYGMVSLELERRLQLPECLNRLGDASYSIYLSHVPLLTLFGHLWAKLTIPGYADNALVLTSMTAAVIVYGVASYRWLERPLYDRVRAWGKATLHRRIVSEPLTPSGLL